MSNSSTDPVSVEIIDGVARLTMNHPPVNALSLRLRKALADALSAVAADPGITAVLLAGQPKAFSAGADISEFGAGAGSPPDLPTLVAMVEDFPVPVIAALTGVALGGGLELAMAAAARIAAPDARLGLPEISLGLLPGAGGTGRLPRLVGPERAVEMILGGQQISADQGLRDGLLDAVLADPTSEEGLLWATGFAQGDGDPSQPSVGVASHGEGTIEPLHRRPPTRQREDKIAAARANPGSIATLAAARLAKAKDPFAARAAIDAITAGVELSFEEGARVEREKFEERRASAESGAQRHLFAAERAARKPKNLDPRAAKHVARAGVVGAGTMGGGIAMALAAAGIPVTIVEAEQQALDRGLARVRENLTRSVEHGSRSESDAQNQLALIGTSLDYAAFADADLVIEAAFEDLQVKRDIFATLDRHVRPDAVLASNTSYLDIDQIAAGTAHPGRVLGLHFFSPANVMPLVEVVRGAKTDAQTLATGFALARLIGKTPVVVGVCHGFVGNRMLEVRSQQAERLLLEGALPGQVDKVLTDFGFRMGPFAMGDMAGLDIGWRNRKAQGVKAPVSDALCEAGRFGQKTGAGYYAYDGRGRRDDAAVAELIAGISASLGVPRRDISAEEILERLTFPMINEGARILAEGIADRSGDIDVIWVKGYNWPAYRGGPMWYADQVGLPRVAARLRHYAEQTEDESLRPAGLLARGADDDGASTAGGLIFGAAGQGSGQEALGGPAAANGPAA
ncbi:enoyl-CoA hydratase/isomerase family protein [Paenarthrobacter sp. Z7-10]|uniref:3-hydroxyacyl-CoA dehydrogenase NAD-binding domain-containing protein n=1 Tax=Paenarthrobacter sp. Z7-10 TaxID=2787635 RepID=UPI0022A9577D|nr:3-hydroxyacyl-CoA dehydrogenase NAD-binding domain-containing protein [Paenarthrobacter sp. Z7-10]MCZ2402009.1 enoyl-CoA hydratase/isomerase family protein [Paenarthrobacter sp. Z7-10]